MKLAVIPARGGSNRIPRKNVVDFFGVPMIAHTIVSAIQSEIFDAVVVSTDDEEIAAVSAAYGAEVSNRPVHLGENRVAVSDVVLNVAQQRTEMDTGSVVCMLMANCPLRCASDIREQYEYFSTAETSLVSVVPFQGVYPEWALTRDDSGIATWNTMEKLTVSQELAESYCPTGAIWWSTLDSLCRFGSFYSDPFRVMPLSLIRGWDIDEPEDLEVARILTLGLHAQNGRWPLPLGGPR